MNAPFPQAKWKLEHAPNSTFRNEKLHGEPTLMPMPAVVVVILTPLSVTGPGSAPERTAIAPAPWFGRIFVPQNTTLPGVVGLPVMFSAPPPTHGLMSATRTPEAGA